MVGLQNFCRPDPCKLRQLRSDVQSGAEGLRTLKGSKTNRRANSCCHSCQRCLHQPFCAVLFWCWLFTTHTAPLPWPDVRGPVPIVLQAGRPQEQRVGWGRGARLHNGSTRGAAVVGGAKRGRRVDSDAHGKRSASGLVLVWPHGMLRHAKRLWPGCHSVERKRSCKKMPCAVNRQPKGFEQARLSILRQTSC